MDVYRIVGTNTSDVWLSAKRLWDHHPEAAVQRIEYEEGMQFEDGEPYYVYVSGRDCDGVEYGYAEMFNDLETFEAWREHQAEWLDGPEWYTSIDAAAYRQMSGRRYHRDRGLEAFEDGHPHYIEGGNPPFFPEEQDL